MSKNHPNIEAFKKPQFIWTILECMQKQSHQFRIEQPVRAFKIIYQYLKQNSQPKFNLMIIIITAFLNSCKISDIPINIQDVYHIYLKSCQYLYKEKFKSSPNFLRFIELDNFEPVNSTDPAFFNLVYQCQIQLISINSNMTEILPFDYLEEIFSQPEIFQIPVPVISALKINVNKAVLFSILKLSDKIINPKFIAAAAMSHGYDIYVSQYKSNIPKIEQWIEKIKSEAGDMWNDAIIETLIPEKKNYP